MQHYRREPLELHGTTLRLEIDAQVGEELPESNRKERGFCDNRRHPGHDDDYTNRHQKPVVYGCVEWDLRTSRPRFELVLTQ